MTEEVDDLDDLNLHCIVSVDISNTEEEEEEEEASF